MERFRRAYDGMTYRTLPDAHGAGFVVIVTGRAPHRPTDIEQVKNFATEAEAAAWIEAELIRKERERVALEEDDSN